MSASTTPAQRSDELAAALGRVQQRIDNACMSVGRDRSAVTLIVITKFFPEADIRALVELGVRDIGESRDQEAATKVATLPAPIRDRIRLHFVGQLQTRKSGSVARYADVVHSVDRPKLVHALDRGAQQAGRILDALVQVSLDGDRVRGGAPVAEVPALADLVAGAPALRLRGVMAVAPRDGDPHEAFAALASLAAGIRTAHPQATWVSAGMSADLEAAVANGATHLRVGSAILGSRPAQR